MAVNFFFLIPWGHVDPIPFSNSSNTSLPQQGYPQPPDLLAISLRLLYTPMNQSPDHPYMTAIHAKTSLPLHRFVQASCRRP